MVGGDAEALARVRPILECMGNPERIVHVGSEPGSGQVCKVCNQMAIGGALAGVSEAFAIAQKGRRRSGRVREALLGGFAASRVLEVHGERMIKKNYVPGFRTRLYQKDLRLANEVAGAHGVAAPGNGHRHPIGQRADRVGRRRSGLLGARNRALRSGGTQALRKTGRRTGWKRAYAREENRRRKQVKNWRSHARNIRERWTPCADQKRRDGRPGVESAGPEPGSGGGGRDESGRRASECFEHRVGRTTRRCCARRL